MGTANLFIPYVGSGEFQALASGIAGDPGTNSWWTEIPLGCPDAAVVVARVKGAEIAGWLRAVSRETGGFCVAQSDERSEPMIYYSGSGLAGLAYDTWSGCFEELCGLTWRENMAAFDSVAPAVPAMS